MLHFKALFNSKTTTEQVFTVAIKAELVMMVHLQ